MHPHTRKKLAVVLLISTISFPDLQSRHTNARKKAVSDKASVQGMFLKYEMVCIVFEAVYT